MLMVYSWGLWIQHWAQIRGILVGHDGLGSSVGMVDSAGVISRSFLYEDFGNVIEEGVLLGSPVLNYQYAGYQWNDAPHNMYSMKYRQTYDAVIGRFGQEDPILQTEFKKSLSDMCQTNTLCTITSNALLFLFKNPQLFNSYLYTENNPVNWSDQTGLVDCPEGTHKVFNWTRFMKCTYTNLSMGILLPAGCGITLIACFRTGSLPWCIASMATCSGTGIIVKNCIDAAWDCVPNCNK